MSNQRTLLIMSVVILVLLLVFVSSQSGENSRLRLRLTQVQEDAVRRQSELERDLSASQSQSLLFSARIDELRNDLLQSKVGLNGHGSSAKIPESLTARLKEIETKQLALEQSLENRLGAADEQRMRIVESLAMLTKQIGEKSTATPAAPDVEAIKAALASEFAAASTRVDTLAAELTKLAASFEASRTGEAAQAATGKEVSEALTALKGEVAALTSKLAEHSTGLGAIGERIQKLEALVATAKAGGDSNSENAHQSGRTEAQGNGSVPEIEVAVRIVDMARGVLVFDAGEPQGLQTQQLFELFRGSEVLGQVRVLRVSEDMAGGKITQLSAGAVIQAGDRARLLAVPKASPSTGGSTTSQVEPKKPAPEAEAPGVKTPDAKGPPPPPPGS